MQLNGITREEADAIADERREQLEQELSESRSDELQSHAEPSCAASGVALILGGDVCQRAGGQNRCRAQNDLASLLKQADGSCREIFIRIRRSKSFSKRGAKWRDGKEPLDWSAAEALAFATLAMRGRSHPA